jgi:endoglycosylceramidase
VATCESTPLAAALVCAAALLFGAAPAAALPRVSHVGRWLTDPKGRVVVLHGAQVDRFRPGEPVEYIDLSSENVRFIAAQGFNAVRTSMAYAGVEPTPGQFDDAYVDSYLAFDRELARAGVYDLIDMMQGEFAAKVGGWGMPDWMALTDGVPNNAEPYPRGYLDNPAEQRVWDNFWANTPTAGAGLQDHYAAGLRRLAARFAHAPGLLGWEILNEPWPGSQTATCASPIGCPPGGFDQTALTNFYRRVIRAIRSVDPVHPVIYEPNLLFDFGADTKLGDVGDANAIFAFHNYCFGAMPGVPALPDPLGLCGVQEGIVFDNAQKRAARSGDALLLDEFGATADTALIRRIAAAADAHMVGWTWWAYEDCCGNAGAIVRDGTKPPTGNNLNLPVLEALARPYPQAIAGTPTSWSYDPDARRFTLTYSTARIGGGRFKSRLVTRAELPRLAYPSGYRTDVTGARVVSKPGSEHLKLRALPGATTVRLTITPA